MFPSTGSRKDDITRWVVTIFLLGTIAYLGTLSYLGKDLPEGFLTDVVIAIGLIGGSAGTGKYFTQRLHEETGQRTTARPDAASDPAVDATRVSGR